MLDPALGPSAICVLRLLTRASDSSRGRKGLGPIRVRSGSLLANALRLQIDLVRAVLGWTVRVTGLEVMWARSPVAVPSCEPAPHDGTTGQLAAGSMVAGKRCPQHGHDRGRHQEEQDRSSPAESAAMAVRSRPASGHFRSQGNSTTPYVITESPSARSRRPHVR